LCALAVTPEIRAFGLFVQLGEALRGGINVKDASSAIQAIA